MWFLKKRVHRKKLERDVEQIQEAFLKDLRSLEDLLELSQKKKEIFSGIDRLWSKRRQEVAGIIKSLIPIIDNQLRFVLIF